MSLQDMSQTQRRAWLNAAVWTVAGFGFLVTFFAGGGAGDFPVASGRHLAGAACVAFGFVGYWAILWFTRQRRGGGPLSDERDAQIVAQAGQTTLIIVLVAVFAFAIGLWTTYEGTGSVPVGWMWFLAYGSVILAFLTFAVVTLMAERGVGGHG